MKTLLTSLLPLLLMAGCASHPTRIRGEAPCDLPDPLMDSSGNRIWESTEGKCGNQWAVRRPTNTTRRRMTATCSTFTVRWRPSRSGAQRLMCAASTSAGGDRRCRFRSCSTSPSGTARTPATRSGAVVCSSEPSERFRGYGELVLLINPAIEAMRYMPLQSAIEYYANRKDEPRLTFEHEKKPRLVILSSEGDWATRKTFPVARFFSTALEAHNRTISELKSPDDEGSFREWNMDVSTVGNYDRFQTHWPLRIAKARDDAPNEASAKVKKLDSNGIQECHSLALAEMQKRMSNQAEKEPSLEDEFGQFPDSNIRVVRRPNTINNSPYIVADVGTEIVADHSKIDSENLICWINQIVDAD
jgi:hypothetical protein